MGEHVQCHFGGHVRERFHLEVRRAHPRLDGAERMPGGLAALLHRTGKAVEPRLGSLERFLMFPSPDAALLARCAIALQRTIAARTRPVDVHRAALFFNRHAAREVLNSSSINTFQAGPLTIILIVLFWSPSETF